MQVYFIRHGMTEGNQSKRYVGTTDESLCEEGMRRLNEREYPAIDLLYASPLKRCIETAAILYPQVSPVIIPDLRECDFGRFEYKNYIELQEDLDYKLWIESNGTLPFPEGESRDEFQLRCTKAFERVMCELGGENTASSKAAFIVHGGTIMSILSYYAVPKEDYFYWSVLNGCGLITEIDGKMWMDGQKIIKVRGYL